MPSDRSDSESQLVSRSASPGPRPTARLTVEIVHRETIVVAVFDRSYEEAWRDRVELAAPYVPEGYSVVSYSAEGVSTPPALLEQGGQR